MFNSPRPSAREGASTCVADVRGNTLDGQVDDHSSDPDVEPVEKMFETDHRRVFNVSKTNAIGNRTRGDVLRIYRDAPGVILGAWP